MTTPASDTPPEARAPMTPERWRAVDAILQAVLACEPEQRAAFVAEACGDDRALRREVESLLAATPTGDFLEQPAAAALGVAPTPVALAPLSTRLSTAVAGRYVVEREVARGGMATVHLALDSRHQRPVAIKVLREELAAALGAERFLKEIQVTAALQHPHVLPLFDSGSAGGLLYYVMPFVDGETLRARLVRERQLPVAEAVRIATEVAGALDYAHRRGVVHRDIKPENVLLQGGGQDAHALVADFGIALALEQAGGERITRTGLTLGTPQYMAPEQATGERNIDHRADVYALGAVLYEMLAGEAPFSGPGAQAVVTRVLTEPPRPLASRRSDVPPYVDAAIRRALEKRPADRFPSAAAFAAALVAPPVVTASADGARDRSVPLRTTAKVAVAALGVGLALGVVVGRETVGSGVPFIPNPTAAIANTPLADIVAPALGQGDLALTVVDRSGRAQRSLPANRPWTPRFSPDGRRVAYGAYGEGRGTSDVWVTEVETGVTRRVTDDEGDGNDVQWSPDGTTLAYSLNAPEGKDVHVQRVTEGAGRPLARRAGNQFPSDWLRDGSAVLVTDDATAGNRDIWVQPTNGSPARAWIATDANETAARVSPDGRWVAYTSDESGRDEVYVQSFPKPGLKVMISAGGGMHPAWKGDGRELYYWQGDRLVAARLDVESGGGAPVVGDRTPLFRAPYHGAINAMYDVSPDGSRFVIVLERAGR